MEFKLKEDEMRNIAIIQARLGSSRLPKKVLLDLSGKSILERVVERVKRSSLIDEVIVATTVKEEDIEVLKLCEKFRTLVYRGSENDVLDRYYQAAKQFNAGNVIRVTADCPLIDYRIIDKVIKLHLSSKADYTSNILEETYPDGEDVEVFTFSALEKAWGCATLLSEREHVTPYIRKNGALFKLSNLKNSENLSDKRWTVDEPSDYEFIKLVYDHLYKVDPFFSMEDVLKLLEIQPELEKINQGIIRNEGYLKSLKEDRVVSKKMEN